MNRVIQGLWIGSELSALERLSITSFLTHNHEFDLYVYGPVRGAPEGVRLQNAAEIVPREQIFQYQGHASYAGFANFFRYKLLLERGGWWVDLDVVCLQPFDFIEDFVFCSERDQEGRQVPGSAVIKAPPGSEIMAELWRTCQAKDSASIFWGETGPRLLALNLPRFGLTANIQESHVFCAVAFFEWQRVLDPRASWSFPDDTRALHFWNEMWRRTGQEKDAAYDPDCLYEQLKARYGIRTFR